MPRPYPPEFRARAIALVCAGKQAKQTAVALGIHPVTLSKWLRQDDIDNGRRPGTPKSVPSDLLAGLLDNAATPLGRLTDRLGRRTRRPRQRHSHDPDGRREPRARHTRNPPRPAAAHPLYLEELTHRLASEWLAYRHRHRRWPACTNPHLLVSQKTAWTPTIPPSASACFA